MRLNLEWEQPIPLRRKRGSLIFTIDLDRIAQVPGVYIFARKWGPSYEALYVGKSTLLKSRIRSHLNNLNLVNHIHNARNGKRVVIIGYPHTLPGQRMSKVLTVLERVLIRHFLSEAHDLVNKQGARIRRHEIEASGRGVPKAFVPSLMYLEKARGE